MTSAILIIARNEFYRVMYNPLVIVVGVILLILTYINAAGDSQNLLRISMLNNIDGFIFGYSQIWYITNFICAIMAVFIGVMAMASERNTNSIGILLTKPLYRRDVVLGKYIGINLFLFIFLVIMVLANSLVLCVFYGGPSSLYELIWRITAYVFIVLMDLSLVTGIAMLIGILFKDLLVAVSVSVLYLSYEWFWVYFVGSLSKMLNNLPVAPYMITMKILGLSGDTSSSCLFMTTTGFSAWISNAYPSLFLMAFLITLILLVDCFAYARMEYV